MITILIVDDHSVVRQGLQMFFKLDPEFEVVGEAANGVEAVRLARTLKPDVVLMDLNMPIMNGIEATERIKRELPETEVIALTSFLDDTKLYGVIRAGAIGYLLKDTEAEELLMAIKAAKKGPMQFSPRVTAYIASATSNTQLGEVEELTPREREVLKLIVQGLSNKEIALSLGIGEGTVKTHVNNLFSKLRVVSRTQAALYAVRNGLIHVE